MLDLKMLSKHCLGMQVMEEDVYRERGCSRINLDIIRSLARNMEDDLLC